MHTYFWGVCVAGLWHSSELITPPWPPRLPLLPASRTPGASECSTPKLFPLSSTVCVAPTAPGCSTRAARSRFQQARHWWGWCYAFSVQPFSCSAERGWRSQGLQLGLLSLLQVDVQVRASDLKAVIRSATAAAPWASLTARRQTAAAT
jgi:hypothetical protein